MIDRLGWTLLHFLWQGLVISALYAIVRGAESPQRRYVLACAALAAMLATPVATYVLLGAPETAVATPVHRAGASRVAEGTTFNVTAAEIAPSPPWTARILPSVVMTWFAGATILLVRLMTSCVAATRLRKRQTRPAPAEWQQAIERLKRRIQVARPVRLLVSGLVEVPGVIGWIRPVILMPAGALAGLPPEHVEAFLLHELAHIRRHDYLVNVVQSIAEALLFYHPAVWWISGKIRAERELCCDDLAVAATGDAFTYATALADLELRRPIHALAANGGNLANRIARILGRPRRESGAPGAAAIAILLAASAWLALAQSAERPKFEVAAIKPVEAKSFTNITAPPGGRLRAENASLRLLMMNAYHLQDFQIIGGPSWLGDQGFDIEAKSADGGDKERVMLMLQSLIEDRFKLQYHRETRELPVFALSVVKGGPKLPAPKEGGCVKVGDAPPLPKPGEPPPVWCGNVGITTTPRGAGLQGGDVPMSDLVRHISMMLGRPVLDKTGITSNFDVILKFTIDDTVVGMTRPWGNVAGHREMMMPNASNDPNAPPTFMTAMRDQLGLKLDSTKGPAEVMVIDHVEKPSGN